MPNDKIPLQIPDSFDEILQNENKAQEAKELSLDERFAKERLEWTNKVHDMSQKIKSIDNLASLQVDVYTERQRAVEYHHYLISILSQLGRAYRKQYSERYDFHSYKSDKRFTNEKTKELHILSEIGEIVRKRETIDNHTKFIDNTIKTIDNLIYGIKYRIEIEQIKRGQ